eukprot:3913213-Rhodomonas_salina.3
MHRVERQCRTDAPRQRCTRVSARQSYEEEIAAPSAPKLPTKVRHRATHGSAAPSATPTPHVTTVQNYKLCQSGPDARSVGTGQPAGREERLTRRSRSEEITVSPATYAGSKCWNPCRTTRPSQYQSGLSAYA